MVPARLIPLAGSLLALASVHGTPARHEIGIGAGGGQYYFTGCNTPPQEGSFGELQAWYRLQQENGLSVAVEGSAMLAAEHVIGDPSAPMPIPAGRWNDRIGGLLAARVGYHFRYGGAEAGPALVNIRLGEEEIAPVLPSLRLWLGNPRYVYAFGSFLAEETRGQARILGFGFGHASERVRAVLGGGASQGDEGSVFSDLSFRISPSFWLGTGLQFGGRRTWSALGTLVFGLH